MEGLASSALRISAQRGLTGHVLPRTLALCGSVLLALTIVEAAPRVGRRERVSADAAAVLTGAAG